MQAIRSPRQQERMVQQRRCCGDARRFMISARSVYAAANVSSTSTQADPTAASASSEDEDDVYRRRPPFPFVCIEGQESMRRALLVNAVDPAVGGVILLGDRGTGKSIAVKAMADIMPVRVHSHITP